MLHEPDNKRSTVLHALLVGFLFTLLPWMVFAYEKLYDVSLAEYGILPRNIRHIYGIVTSPFLHADIWHLLSNSTPLFILTSFLFYFYKKFFWGVYSTVFLLSGFWTWLIGRPDFHIGASGVIYGLTSYIFFSGVWSKNYRLSALSMLTVFLYGSVVWGIFPMETHISWEGHLSGFIAGLVMSFYYKKQLPARKKFDWELVDDQTEYVQVPVEEIENGVTVTRFIYVPKKNVINLDDYEPQRMD